MPSSGSLARATMSMAGARFAWLISATETLAAASQVGRTQTAGSNPADRASDSAASARLGAIHRHADGVGLTGPRSRSRPGSASASAVSTSSHGARCDQHRLRRVRRVALVCQGKRCRARAADQQTRVTSGIEHVQQFGRSSLHGDNGNWLLAFDAHRAAGPKCGDRPSNWRRSRQISISQISGHMVGRPLPARQGSSTSWAGKVRPRARAMPTYGRAGGRGRSWSSRATDSSTR